MRKILYLFMVLAVAFTVYGCATGGGGGSHSGLPPGVSPGSPIPSPEATLTGAVGSLGGGVATLNLGAIIPTGSSTPVAVSLDKMAMYVTEGTITSSDISASDTWTALSFGFYDVSATPIDVLFVLDNTGSMGDQITSVKDSIVNFAQTLEAGGVDAKFGLVTYGDSALHPTPAGYITEEGFNDSYYGRPVQDFTTASSLESVLATVQADGGADAPENPLDCVKWALKTHPTTGAFTNMTWRPGAQKVMIIITDITGHQTSEVTFIHPINGPVTDESSDNKCTTTIMLEQQRVRNFNVKVYAVSPNYTTSRLPYCDVRLLADGFGEGRTTAEAVLLSSGGQWMEMPWGGNVDLAELGIAETVIGGETIRIEGYTFEAGKVYTLIVYYDVDGDGVLDSYAYFVFTYTAATSSSGVNPGGVGRILKASEILPLNRSNN